MADKDFKVKNKLFVNGLSHNSGVILATNNNLDAHTNVPTQYGGTGTTTSPNAGEVLYSTSGSTYAPSNLATLVQSLAPDEVTYSSSAPSSPTIGQVWIDSDSEFGSFDPNIIRRQAFTATSGQTIFTTTVSFVEGYEQVYFNGLLLLRTTDYTTSGGNTVTLSEAAAAGDIVEVVTVTNLNSVNTYTQSEINTALALKANLVSPTFTGTPLAPTADPGTNTTQLATTAFVTSALSSVTVTAEDDQLILAGQIFG